MVVRGCWCFWAVVGPKGDGRVWGVVAVLFVALGVLGGSAVLFADDVEG